mmetsp:Transcript_19852/g.63076  ORF Transcript_19852/g.63076 Transcript_19852/m.63076 type:complete len:334 (+) Transcript_19852:484-1485(+)
MPRCPSTFVRRQASTPVRRRLRHHHVPRSCSCCERARAPWTAASATRPRTSVTMRRLRQHCQTRPLPAPPSSPRHHRHHRWHQRPPPTPRPRIARCPPRWAPRRCAAGPAPRRNHPPAAPTAASPPASGRPGRRSCRSDPRERGPKCLPALQPRAPRCPTVAQRIPCPPRPSLMARAAPAGPPCRWRSEGAPASAPRPRAPCTRAGVPSGAHAAPARTLPAHRGTPPAPPRATGRTLRPRRRHHRRRRSSRPTRCARCARSPPSSRDAGAPARPHRRCCWWPRQSPQRPAQRTRPAASRPAGPRAPSPRTRARGGAPATPTRSRPARCAGHGS